MEAAAKVKCYPAVPDSKLVYEGYWGPRSGFRNETVSLVMPALVEAFSSGSLKGDTVIGMSIGPYIHLLLPACNCFENLIFSGPTNECIQEVEKWKKNEPGAVDISYIAKLVCELQGKGEQWAELQSMMQTKLKQVLQHDITNTNPLSPILLPQADCLILGIHLGCLVEDHESFCNGLKNVSSLLKPGGHMIMISCSETSFYMVGKYKHTHLYFKEDFLRKSLTDNGYSIKELRMLTRKSFDMFDVSDFNGLIYVLACKEANE